MSARRPLGPLVTGLASFPFFLPNRRRYRHSAIDMSTKGTPAPKPTANPMTASLLVPSDSSMLFPAAPDSFILVYKRCTSIFSRFKSPSKDESHSILRLIASSCDIVTTFSCTVFESVVRSMRRTSMFMVAAVIRGIAFSVLSLGAEASVMEILSTGAGSILTMVEVIELVGPAPTHFIAVIVVVCLMIACVCAQIEVSVNPCTYA
jgi:hypothetical protein